MIPTELTTCPVCRAKTPERLTAGDRRKIECPVCGTFALSGTQVAVLRDESWDESRPKISAWLRSRLREGADPILSEGILASIKAAPPAQPLARMDDLLLEFDAATVELGSSHSILHPRFFGASGSRNAGEIYYLQDALLTLGYLQLDSGSSFKFPDAKTGGMREEHMRGSLISPEGYARISELRSKKGSGSNAFVAMSFDPALAAIYTDGIEPSVRIAGYTAKRVDKDEHNNRIDDQILAMINTSSFVVADFTQQRAGVYFEAGFGLGQRLPVIWTCDQSDFKNLHFDTRQYNFILWESAADLADRLAKRILGTIGPGPLYGGSK